jgi:hypothetical protein
MKVLTAIAFAAASLVGVSAYAGNVDVKGNTDIKGRSTLLNQASGRNSIANFNVQSAIIANGAKPGGNVDIKGNLDIKGRATLMNKAENGGRANMNLKTAVIGG